MTREEPLGYVAEPQKQVPIAYDVDVAVVGGGLSGMFSAIAAGRQGVKTLLLDRFASLGGNLGPAMIVGGSVAGEAPVTLPGGLAGIPQELNDRMEALRSETGHRYADVTNIISHLAAQMALDAGVEILVPVWVGDPIIEENRVTGLFVEGKSGRVAVRAKIVIDASADADVCRRAGVPVITDMPPDPSWPPVMSKQFLRPEFVPWNDTAIYFVMADVDFERFEQFLASDVTLSAEDEAWLAERQQFPFARQAFEDPMIPLLRQAWESGEFYYLKTVEPHVHINTPNLWKGPYDNGLVGSRINMGGAIRRDDMKQHARLETAIRMHVFETVQFFRKYVPGFERAYLLIVAPYFGSRGGPHIDGEYTITPEDTFNGAKFDDVLYRNTHAAQPQYGGEASGFDTPYRSLLPKGMDGLLATGRASAYIRRGHDPGATRARPALMQLGEAAGVAAAMAVQDGIAPRDIEVKKLQRHLLQQGFYLGEPARLAQLGLADS